MNLRYTIGTLLLALGLNTNAQLTVDTAINPVTLNTFLTGFGMSISNLVVNCDPGSIGTFVSNGSNIGMSDGLALSSGRVAEIPGPNDQVAVSGDMNALGDSDLEAIAGFNTYDACVIEFDCVPVHNTLLFNYVFGSEEYLEFANTGFNDVFAIFISGPGFPSQQNIALLPGTSTPVTIDNVNDVDNTAYYVDNGDGASPPQNMDPMVVQYDGLTVNLIGQAVVQPNETYHMKFAVADAGDHVFDSGVMIEANSLRSEPSVGIVENENELEAHVRWDYEAQDHVLQLDLPGTVQIEIFDRVGALVVHTQANASGPLYLNSSQFRPGLYLVRLSSAGKETTLRFVVE